MIKATTFLVLLSLVLVSVVALDAPTEVRGYRKCPCKCFTGRRIKRAERQCKRAIFRYQCSVQDCVPDYKPHGYKGKYCCERTVIPTQTASATPSPSTSPSPSPSASPKVECPCHCGKRGAARAQCRYLPHCEVTRCPEEEHVKPAYGYSKPKPEFQCCYKKHYAPS